MNEKNPLEAAINEMVEKLMKVGFATGYSDDENTGTLKIAWTDSGIIFRDNVRLIFAQDSTPDEIKRRMIVFTSIILNNRVL